jgi:nucleoside-diphosphate-sugar epimerase
MPTEHPMALYAATKKANEMMAHSYSHLYDLPTSGLRFFTVYGPWGRPDMALFLFAEAIRNGKPIHVFNYGKMIRDFTYVDDIVESVDLLDIARQAVNVASYNGDAIIKITIVDDKPKINLIDNNIWYPIINGNLTN